MAIALPLCGLTKYYGEKRKIVYFILYILAGVSAFILTANFVLPWYQLKQIEHIVNKNLPKQLNEITTLDKVRVNLHNYHYFYTLNGMGEDFDFDKSFNRSKVEIFDPDLIQSYCDTLNANARFEEVRITYTYKDNSKEFSFNHNDCKK